MNDKQKLIFIYNAESGLINGIIDYLHKIFSPDSYDCSLCKLTYNNLGKIRKWRKFLKSSNYEIVFAYKDHLKIMGIDNGIKLPTVLLNDNSILFGSSEIESCKSLDELIDKLKSKINSI